jgi:hypothetical protein
VVLKKFRAYDKMKTKLLIGILVIGTILASGCLKFGGIITSGIPSPAPAPPPQFRVDADFSSLEGFNYMEKEDVNRRAYTMLVLPPGGSGAIPITLASTGNESYTITLDLRLAGERGVEFRGVRYSFAPSTVKLEAGQRVDSTLSIEVDLEAPTGLYSPSMMACASGRCLGYAPFDLLVSQYTPSYAFDIYVPAPGVPTPYPPSSPPPAKPPAIELKEETAYIMFFITTSDPDLPAALNFTYGSNPVGSVPPGITARLIQDPLEVVPRPSMDRFFTLAMDKEPGAPAHTYKMVVKGSVGPTPIEREFYLAVNGH